MLTHLWISALIILSGWNCHTHPTSRPPPPTLPTQSSWSFLPFGSESSRSPLRACGLELHICTHICHSTHHIEEQLSLSDSVNQLWVVEAQRYIFYFWILQFSSVQFSRSVVSDSLQPHEPHMPGLPVLHQLLESTQTHVRWVGDAIQPSHPLLSPSPPALNLSQHQSLFKWVSSSLEVAKVLEFQLQHQSFQWTPRTGLL